MSLLEWSLVETQPLFVYTIVAALAISLLNYTITSILYDAANSKATPKIPPTIPHFIPFLGPIPWTYFRNPLQFFTSGYFSKILHPVRLRLFNNDLYLIAGAPHVLAHLAQTTTSNTIFNANFLRQACGMSDAAVARLGSESEATPAYFERKKYLAAAPLYAWSSSVIHRYLAGKGAHKLAQRFEANLRERMGAHPALSAPDGLILTDFQDVFTNDVTSALLDSMCGKGLLELNPEFAHSFGIFCGSLPTFMKRVPALFAPNIYAAREECLAGMRRWQGWASENFNTETTPVDADGDDPFWGSKFFRERFSQFVYEMGFDAKDMASMELGFLFGASANVTANTYWCVIDVFRDQNLLRDIRKEVEICKVQEIGGWRLDVNMLVQQPLLQAVFAESLRLRCHNMFIRKTTQPINIGDWAIPIDCFVVAWSTPGHMDPAVWDARSASHPVSTFWPGRFLEFTDGATSPQFSLTGTEGSWLPFGSGANLCPGRQFAKVHCVVTLALMVDMFNCDVLASHKDFELDWGKFGMGVLGPKGGISVRLKRRQDK